MTRALVLVEMRGGSVTAGSLGAVAVAASASHDVHVLVVAGEGEVVDGDTVALLGGQGASEVHVARSAPSVAAVRTDLLDLLVTRLEPSIVIVESSSMASDVAAALAARRSAGVNWDLVGLELDATGAWVGTRLALQDTLVARVGWTTPLAVAVLRPGTFVPREPTENAAGESALELPDLDLSIAPVVTTVAGEQMQSGIETAEIIVSGGRGVATREGFEALEELAATLGGALAVSMPVVDKGWYPYSFQVGQTGRTVRPRLYLACGISGAIQHRVGMARSGTIVVVNTDPRAPLFGVCDFGVVGDLSVVVPRLTALIRERR